MNDGNLVSLADRTTEEQRKIARMGGIRSGEVRRERKALREALEEALALPCEVEGMELTNVEAVAVALVREAREGNVSAFRELRNTVDGVPTQRIETAPAISEEARREVEAVLFGFMESEVEDG